MKVVSTYFFYNKIEQYKPMQLMELHKGKNFPLIPSEFWQRDAQKHVESCPDHHLASGQGQQCLRALYVFCHYPPATNPWNETNTCMYNPSYNLQQMQEVFDPYVHNTETGNDFNMLG